METLSGIDVFGSYARGSTEPGDIDLNIEYDQRRHYEMFGMDCLRGKGERELKRALVGGIPGNSRVGMIFQARRQPERYPFELTPLWQAGDNLDVALARLHAIAVDPEARPAQREYMIPPFKGLEKVLPTFLRQYISEAVEAGAIKVEQIEIEARQIADRSIARVVDRRWKSGGALNRTGHAIVAYYERRGIDPGLIHLQGHDLRDKDTPYFGGFGLRYIRHVPHWFTEFGGIEHLELPHQPTNLTRPLIALRITAVDVSRFDKNHPSWNA